MTNPPDPAAPPAAPAPAADVDARLGRIEATVSALAANLHPAAQAHTERRLERPQRIEEQVEAALRQAEKDRQAEADKADLAKFRKDTETALNELRETKPAAAVRGVTRAMWG